jgi:hypothetical protein
MTDTNPGCWPDAARPGYPANPERDGVHWLNIAGDVIAAQWWTADALWTWGDRQWTPSVASAARWFYLGPCHTPAEVAALERERDRLLRAMNQISMVGLGPDPGSAQWQIGTARAIAREAIKEAAHD